MLPLSQMPTPTEVEQSMKQRLLHECERLSAIYQEKDQLAKAYNRFLDLAHEQIRRERRLQRIVAVLGAEKYVLLACNETNEGPISSRMVMDADTLRDSLPLWEAMKEYLHHVGECRIAELEEFFDKNLGVNFPGANRQAIESALKRHSETFKTRKKGREKYISLKDSARD